ncbi:MAG: AbrB/MazE/SpoVT family DNA-binding domain-containing protein [candidate division NC10 bacterium]|nr:AbrB/MazE/SpoVT family DNA-binding domain-containing protein [candidate division NC10 bacterium]
MPVVTTSAKGQVVIPAEFRKRIGLKPGGKVLVALAGEKRVTIEPIPDDPIQAACGFLKGGPSLTKALLKERRDDQRREEAKFARFLRSARLPQQGKGVRKG